jgi:intracellular sulfur oxidation DsrE/DsrF family protein
MNTLRAIAAALALTFAPAALPAAPADKPAPTRAKAEKPAPVKVVYHVNEGNEQASNALRNIRNHLTADPTAKIVVVTHFKGIDFLLEGAQDKNGNPYDAMVDELSMQGVEFRVCNFTLVGRKIDPKTVHPEAKIVPSGVAEVSRLQAQEGYVYLKP